MVQLKYPPAEISRRGKEIYERDLRAKVEPGNEGKIIVVDVDTGDYAIEDDDSVNAYQQLLKKRPDAALFGIRIGYPAAEKIGSWGGKLNG